MFHLDVTLPLVNITTIWSKCGHFTNMVAAKILMLKLESSWGGAIPVLTQSPDFLALSDHRNERRGFIAIHFNGDVAKWLPTGWKCF